ncbi:hypothetical protein [uncultured Jatrophihabitans sp.]|uniref:hypothetical protein n=1 Tax=uncultured Jatrophihabitans sp. TaxID=1610747 RepID=UPI0035C9E33A
MNAEQVLTATFTDHEDLAPDADEVLSAIQRKLADRHRRVVIRSFTVLGAAAAVVAIALAIRIVGGSPQHLRTAVTPAPVSHSTPPTPTASEAPALPAPDHLTLAAGWLPSARATTVVAANGFGTQYRGYDMTVSGADVYVLVSLNPGTTLPTTDKRGTPHDLTIVGHSAREWAVDFWYDLSFLATPDRVASVSVEVADEHPLNSTTSAAGLRAIGRHVARALRFDANEPIGAQFELTYLPNGVTVGSVQRDNGQDTTYLLAVPHVARDHSNAASIVADYEDASNGSSGAGRGADHGQAGRPVQGYATVVSHNGDTYTLSIPNFHGVPLSLTTGPGVTTVATLYRIADGIRWLG